MDSQHQQQEFLGVSYFQPIHSDLSYECHDDEATLAQEFFNKSIFRQPEDVGVGSPPTVSRANPIGMDEDDDDDDESPCWDDELYNVITPYPYSPCPEELQERQRLESEIPRFATLTSFGDPREVIDYSFYFESNFMDQSQSVWEYGIAQSISTQTGFCMEVVRGASSPTPISDSESTGDAY